jgi:hypothetical protein
MKRRNFKKIKVNAIKQTKEFPIKRLLLQKLNLLQSKYVETVMAAYKLLLLLRLTELMPLNISLEQKTQK